MKYLILLLLAGCAVPSQQQPYTGYSWRDVNDCTITVKIDKQGITTVTINDEPIGEVPVYCQK